MDLDQRGGVGQLWCELADQTEDEPVELADRSRIGRLHRCSVVGGRRSSAGAGRGLQSRGTRGERVGGFDFPSASAVAFENAPRPGNE
jgi:hypothetical protein